MILRVSTILAIAGCSAAAAQEATQRELARLLANEQTRRDTVAKMTPASGKDEAPLLMSWTRKPPPGVDKYELYIGMADAFGQMKTKEAVPFLIGNIGLRRGRPIDFAPWLKTPKAIEETFPAAAALIQIGPDTSGPLIRAFAEPMTAEDRALAIFVISRMLSRGAGIPGARAFLTSALGEANREHQWAQEGLDVLNERDKQAKP